MAFCARLSKSSCAGICILPVFLLCLMTATPARSGSEQGTTSSGSQPAEMLPLPPETFPSLLMRAEAGEANAQCDVGVAYLNGDKTAQDFKKALWWLSRSSDMGFGYARFVLADVYSRGYAGVLVDDAKVYYYATLAAASSSLPEKFRERATKLRDTSAKRLGAAQIAAIQAKAAQAPVDAAVGY